LYAGMNSIAARMQWLWMSAFEQIRMVLGLQ